jgi:hypothetical protein
LRAAKAAGLFTVLTPTAWSAGEDFSAADLLLDDLAVPDADLRELARRHAGKTGRTGSLMRRTA